MSDTPSKTSRSNQNPSHMPIVLAILMVCAYAIFYPVFKNVREEGRYVSCESNMKQLGLAFAQYEADNDNTFPQGRCPAPLQALPVGWAGQIYPYSKDPSQFDCPDDPTKSDNSTPYQVPVSYAYNGNVGNKSLAKGNGTLKVSPAAYKDLADATRTVLLCEVIGVTADIADSHGVEASSPAVLGNRTVFGISIDGSTGGLRYATGVFRCDRVSRAVVGTHTGDVADSFGAHHFGSNILFADGHARCMRPNYVSAGLSNPIGSTDCTSGQGVAPVGKAGSSYAAGTGCMEFNATFSIN
jgi:prepilin-type processing-associated H-X9-DG protein